MQSGAPRPANEQARLAALRALRILDTPSEERFDRFVLFAKHLFAVPIAMISFVDTERQWLKSCYGPASKSTPREYSFCAYTILDDIAFVVPDALLDHRFAKNPLVTGEPHIRFYAGYPIHDHEGYVLGALCLIDTEPRFLLPHDLDLLRECAKMIDQEINLTYVKSFVLPLWKQNLRFHTIFDDAAIGIALLDEHMHFLACNTTFEHILGFRKEKLEDRSFLDLIDTSSHMGTRNQYQALFRHDLPGIHTQYRYVREDGLERILQITLSLTYDSLSAKEVSIALLEDITALIDAEQHLGQTTLEALKRGSMLEQIQKQQLNYISVVSHEFRTALTGILGFSDLLQRGEIPSMDVQDFATDIYQDSQRLLRMINDLLDLKRMDEGQTQLRVESLNMADLLRKQIHFSEVTTTKHTFLLILDEDNIQIEGDQDKLRQVIANLLSNAIKYSPQGGQIIINCQQEESTLSIQIQDQGMGIPPEAIEKIFDSYSRVESEKTRYIQGTGLGLAIVKQIVQMHKGSIWVESQLAQGTTFHITLPVRQDPESETVGMLKRRDHA